ncbi:protein FATTY ACID EXPORT 6-like [Panicum miliaceum]|uniref:Protein FATTY ACID EXPORT 6-like n=1 Tax=Panicum miliaceum TaxID=4540 RepID=A0A3L6QSS5_PANMI|nr:protein FATTY ACID EXPORT 6-like [Panicum miliaceum]
MEDFYVTIPYGLVVLAGGVAGYLKRGSAASLAAGVGFGAALLLAGVLSAWAFARGGGGAGAVFGTVLQIVCAVVLTVVMGVRYVKTRKIMPAGIIAAISAIVLIFYVYKVSTGGNKVYTPVSAE